MKQIIKTIITVFVALVCSFVCLIAAGVYMVEAEYTDYEVAYLVAPTIKNAQITYLGDSYNGKEKEDCSYYLLTVDLDNSTLGAWDEYSAYFSYDTASSGDYYYVNEADLGLSEGQGYGDYYPAGRQITVKKVLCVENGCTGFDIIFGFVYDETEHKRFHITI